MIDDAIDLSQSPWADGFPILSQMDFFNHAGVAPISGRAADAIRTFADQAASRSYVRSGWYKRINEIRQSAARLIGAEFGREIAFVPNTSTGIATIAGGLNWRRGDNVIITDVEYPSNRYPWEDLKRLGVELIEIRQQDDGRFDAMEVADAVNNRTRVVAISHVQYASGYRIDLKPIAEEVHRAGGYLCVDAIQSVGAMPVDVQAWGVDFLAADGHKWMLGPEGAGILYVRQDLIEDLHPPIVGWMNMVNATDYGNYQFEFLKDARRFEPGSFNVPGILALGASIDFLLEVGLDRVWQRIEALTTRLCEGLLARGYKVFSPRREGERSGIVTFLPGKPGANLAEIVRDLDAKNIIVVTREGRLRASPHFYNTAQQIDRLLEALP